jgi:hypothetical protein
MRKTAAIKPTVPLARAAYVATRAAAFLGIRSPPDLLLPVRAGDVAIGEVRRILPSLRTDGANNRLLKVALAGFRELVFPVSVLLMLLVS